MEDAIIFPHLHIVLRHVGQKIMIGNFPIAFYGITMALGMILGSALILHEVKRTGQNEDDYFDIIIWCLIFSVVGARIYYVIFAWSMYKDDPIQIFNIRNGGLAIYGGIIAALITGYVVCRIKKISFIRAADTCIIGVPVGQALGRWGNFFNREAFGQYTNGLFAMQIPLDRVRSVDDLRPEMLKHTVVHGGTTFISVHPTFLYESLWSVGVLILLLILRKHVKFRGQMLFTYLAAYGLGRFWVEGLRTDQLILFNTGIPVSQLLAAVMVVAGVIVLIVLYRRAVKRGEFISPDEVNPSPEILKERMKKTKKTAEK